MHFAAVAAAFSTDQIAKNKRLRRICAEGCWIGWNVNTASHVLCFLHVTCEVGHFDEGIAEAQLERAYPASCSCSLPTCFDFIAFQTFALFGDPPYIKHLPKRRTWKHGIRRMCLVFTSKFDAFSKLCRYFAKFPSVIINSNVFIQLYALQWKIENFTSFFLARRKLKYEAEYIEIGRTMKVAIELANVMIDSSLRNDWQQRKISELLMP